MLNRHTAEPTLSFTLLAALRLPDAAHLESCGICYTPPPPPSAHLPPCEPMSSYPSYPMAVQSSRAWAWHGLKCQRKPFAVLSRLSTNTLVRNSSNPMGFLHGENIVLLLQCFKILSCNNNAVSSKSQVKTRDCPGICEVDRRALRGCRAARML